MPSFLRSLPTPLLDLVTALWRNRKLLGLLFAVGLVAVRLGTCVSDESEADRRYAEQVRVAKRSPGGLAIVAAMQLTPGDRRRVAPVVEQIARNGERECLEQLVVAYLRGARYSLSITNMVTVEPAVESLMKKIVREAVAVAELRLFFSYLELIPVVTVAGSSAAYLEYLHNIDLCRALSMNSPGFQDPLDGGTLVLRDTRFR